MASKAAKGKRKKTRNWKSKGRISLNRMLGKLSMGSTVQVNINPSYHAGIPFRRFQGKTGVIEGMQGSDYIVILKDRGKEKTVVTNPVHLNLISSDSKSGVALKIAAGKKIVEDKAAAVKKAAADKAVKKAAAVKAAA